MDNGVLLWAHLMAGSSLKAILNSIALVLSAPIALWFHVVSRAFPARREMIFQGCTQLVSLLPGVVGEFYRRGFLRLSARHCSAESSVGFGTIFASPEVVIEDGVYIGPLCSIGHARVRRDAMLGTGVHLLGGARAHLSSELDVPIRLQGGIVKFVEVGEDCWIGNGAIVMADVGAHSIVGAGSVVTRPVPAWSVAVGNPARVIRDRRRADSLAL